ncbi:MAG: tyrosine-type recombinase/integrase [Delftia acidovorans]|nr:tyrosine-type recombinase/integrase [Delftia acidovorans]
MARFEVSAVDTALKAAKHQGLGRETEYRVAGNPGLIFVVQSSGKRSWRYYYSIGSGERRLKRKVGLGKYPAVGLAKARAKATALELRVEEEGDVVAVDQTNEEAAEQGALTFSDFFDEYLTLRQGLVRIDEIEREIRKDVIPALGHKRPSEITAADIDGIGTAIKVRTVGANSSAYRVIMHLKAMYNFALLDRPALAAKYVIEKNPAAMLGRRLRGSKSGGIDGYTKPKPRTRARLDDEIREWASAIGASAMRADTKLILKLILVTAQRPGEVRRARRRELHISGNNPVWVIPCEHSKNGDEHRVPLSTLAMSLFKEAIGLSKSDDLVFPNPKDLDEPIPNVVLPTAQANLFRSKLPALEPATAHDLRRTAATGMRRLRVDRDTVGLVLNHTPTGVTARHYDHHEGEEEKRDALNRWAQHLVQTCGLGAARSKSDLLSGADGTTWDWSA